ncbi:HPP family protein [Humisphaera borealis]|uniref:HPP family protein n=1 Tax=Humisphaera borealis TaxID=2807512 RepID=UPI0019D19EB4|nr:HPP family protein [Humisphaera borealis]
MKRFLTLIGLELTPHHHREKLISGLGGFAGIAVVMATTAMLVDHSAVMPVVASLGASAVLLFAAPHGPLSQPWALVMGHLLSAVIGVTCARQIDNAPVAGAASVGLAITAMYYARCIHPPGGATALTAVLGGESLRRLGYSYVLIPVALNVGLILLVAVLFNWLFTWRRYPAALAAHKPEQSVVQREDWAHALREIGSLADVSEDDLAELHHLAVQHARHRHLSRRDGRTQSRPTPSALTR